MVDISPSTVLLAIKLIKTLGFLWGLYLSHRVFCFFTKAFNK